MFHTSDIYAQIYTDERQTWNSAYYQFSGETENWQFAQMFWAQPTSIVLEISMHLQQSLPYQTIFPKNRFRNQVVYLPFMLVYSMQVSTTNVLYIPKRTHHRLMGSISDSLVREYGSPLLENTWSWFCQFFLGADMSLTIFHISMQSSSNVPVFLCLPEGFVMNHQFQPAWLVQVEYWNIGR